MRDTAESQKEPLAVVGVSKQNPVGNFKATNAHRINANWFYIAIAFLFPNS